MVNTALFELVQEDGVDRISTMKSGEQSDCEVLSEAWAWKAIPAAGRRHFIGPCVSLLVR
jgi:hypothetical protein